MSIALMTFDIFGTVLDWRAGLERELGELDFDAVVDRQAELESEQFRSYTEIVAQSLVDEVGLKGEIVSFIGAYAFQEMNQLILAYHVRGHGEIVIGDEIAGVKAVPPDKLRPWPLGTGHAVRDWLAARGGWGPTVA